MRQRLRHFLAASVLGLTSILLTSCEFMLWTTLQATPPVNYREFGNSVACCFETIVVGAPNGHLNSDGTPGAAHIFELVEDEWVENIKLTAGDGTPGNLFGEACASCGKWAAIGAPGANGGKGAVYFYKRHTTSWQFMQKFTGLAVGDLFGASVALFQNKIVVGAPGANGGRGAVRIFKRTTGNFVETQTLKLAAGRPLDVFGASVAVQGNRLLVGAPGAYLARGAAYLYDAPVEGSWSLVQEFLAKDRAPGHKFATSVAVYLDALYMGAPTNGNGAVYEFRMAKNGPWSQTVKFTPKDSAAGDLFGQSIGVDVNVLVCERPGKKVDNVAQRGAVYVFEATKGKWSEVQKIVPPSGNAGMVFGTAVATAEEVIVGGAPGYSNAQGGAAVFGREDAIESLKK